MNAATPLETIPNVDIVHESEVQRQHVRVRLPASIRFKVDGTERRYRLHDVSAGGFSFTCTKERFEEGQLFRGSLLLAGDTVGFTLPVSFDIHSASANGRVSCRFQDLRGQTAAALRHVITSYVGGELVTVGDMLSTLHRQNFVSTRAPKRAGGLGLGSRIRAVLGTSLMLALGIAAFVYTSVRLYDIVVVTHAAAAKIAAPTYTITMPRDGTFFSLLPENGRVAKGQPLGSFQTGLLDVVAGVPGSFKMTPEQLSDLVGQQLSGSLASPCDCVVQKRFVTNEQYVLRNQPVLELVPQTAKPYVLGRFHYDEIRKLAIGRTVHIQLNGAGRQIEGKIAQLRVLPAQIIDSNGLNDLNGLNTNAAITDVIAVIEPSVPLPLTRVDEPVDVRIDPLGSWSWLQY
jgi:alginate biosynthesis protein Alg44